MTGAQSLAGRMTPAQRAQADAARLQARRERQAKTPGPGMYEIRRDLLSSAPARPSSAFRSRTPRTGSPAATDAGDPGAYNPYPRGSLQAGTFHKSSASGAGFFCSSSKREYITSTSEAPGPGAYDLKPATPRETRQSSVFASQSKRDASLTRCESSPGVGAYTPKYPHAPVAISSAFRSTEARFRQDRASNQTNVGPGTYAQDYGTLTQSAGKATPRRPSSAGFGSSSKRALYLPVELDAPGPGTYSTPSSIVVSGGCPSAVFQSATPRQGLPMPKDVGDPGAYNPSPGMSQGAAKTFNRSLSVGAGFFGSTSKRDALSSPLPGADTPGPGAYEVAQPARTEAAQSAAFASQSKRDVHLQSSSSQSPGVGTYTPRHGSGPKGGAAVFKSSEPRFKHDPEAALMAEIGPGSYSQHNGTINGSMRGAGANLSTAFASTTLRDFF